MLSSSNNLILNLKPNYFTISLPEASCRADIYKKINNYSYIKNQWTYPSVKSHWKRLKMNPLGFQTLLLWVSSSKPTPGPKAPQNRKKVTFTPVTFYPFSLFFSIFIYFLPRIPHKLFHDLSCNAVGLFSRRNESSWLPVVRRNPTKKPHMSVFRCLHERVFTKSSPAGESPCPE